MKKKIISSILAVAMIATMAIPSVFAVSSDVSGDAKKVTKITSTKEVYEIPVNEAKDFSEEISVFENETKLVTDQQHIRYKLEGISGDYGDFNILGSKVTPKTVGATAKLTIYDNYNQSTSNARVTVTVKAVAAANGLRAETFTFTNPYKKLPISATNNSAYSETQTMQIKSHPAGSWFPRSDATLQHNTQDVARLTAAMDSLLDDIAWAMFGGQVVNGATIVGTATNGKAAVAANPGTAPTYTITAVTNVVNNDILTIDFDGQRVSKTYTTAAGIPADVNALAADIVTLLNANTTLAAKYTIASAGAVVTITAKTPEVSVGKPVVDVLIAAGTAGTGVVNGALGTAGVAPTSAAARVLATVTYDFSTAVALAAGDTINIGGKTAVVPANIQRDVITQLDTWLSNKTGGDIIGAGEVIVRSGYKIIVTQAEPGADWDPAKVADFSLAEQATSFPTKGTATTVPAGYHNNYDIEWGYNADDKSLIDIKIGYSALETLPAAMVMDVNKPVNSRKMARLDGQNDNFTANVNLQAVVALRATGVQIEKAVYDVMVGEKVPFNFTYYPTNANVGLDAKRDTRPITVTGAAYQYAVVDGDKIIGINSNTPAQARAVVVLTGNDRNPINNQNLGDSTALVNVKPAVYKPAGTDGFTSKISTTALEVEAGKIAPVTISNLPTGVTVKWTHKDDGTMNLNKAEGPAVVVYGKKVGTNVLTASLSNGEKFTVAVTVKAATATPAPTPGTGAGTGSTNVPQTGDTLFSNLF